MEALCSADSHVVETEDCYAEIDPAFRGLRPRAVDDPATGAIMVVPGLDFTVPAGSLSRAGRRYEDWKLPQRWAELHPAGHDPKARLAVQDEEGIVGEGIYPSGGMGICLHKDAGYRKAGFEASHRSLAALSPP